MRELHAFSIWLCLALVMSALAVAAAPQEDPFAEGGINQCDVNFDDVCPDTMPVCNTRARGGAGCVQDLLPFCYESGLFSFRIDAGDRAEFRVKVGIDQVDVFFAQAAAGSGGVMTFFDENGLQVGARLTTNGICSEAMPPKQSVTFDRRIRTIRVRALDTDVYVDSLSLIRQ